MINPSDVLSEVLQDFIKSTHWTYAKTMPKWPHEYIVRERVEEKFFIDLVTHIRAYGYTGKFYNKEIVYFEEDGLIYWTMGAPIEETTIINRCKKEDSYEYRLKNNSLPD